MLVGGPSGLDGPHVFVDDLDRPVLREDDHHHLSRVLRLAAGGAFTVSDGEGRWRRARFGPDVDVDGPIVEVPVPRPALIVAFALVKGARPELVTQKLTEAGIDRIVPFTAARSVVRWDREKAERQATRLRRVALEAARQSRRCWLPVVEEVVPFAEVAERPGAVLADRGGAPLSAGHRLVLVGPEGGWASAERERGLPTVALGDHVLRSETAAIAAGVLLVALRAGIVASASSAGRGSPPVPRDSEFPRMM